MDLKVYYRKLRETEASIAEPYVVVVSLATPDGGRPGVMSETPKEVAARMIVNGQARLASEEEKREYVEKAEQARKAAEQAALAERIQVMVVSEAEGKRSRGMGRDSKGQPA